MASKMVNSLCQAFAIRSQAQGYKGKKRDDMAIEYFAGILAYMLVKDGQTDEWNSLSAWVYMGLCMRGYKAIEAVLNQPKEETKAA